MTQPAYRAIFVLVFALPVVLAQVSRERETVTVRYWPAPLFWQTSATNGDGRGTAGVAMANSPLPSGASPLVFIGMTPCRLVDTRGGGFTGSFGPPSLVAGTSRTFPIQSSNACSVPAVAQAYSFNVTVVPQGPLGFLTVYPSGQSLPLASTLNSLQGLIVANAAVVPAGTNGSVDVFASNPTDVVIDINGYYASSFLQEGTPTFNTAFGASALINTTGGSDTAIGSAALLSNTTGTNNTAVGSFALQSNTIAFGNTGIGSFALGDNTTGIVNTAVGDGALAANSTGASNTASGYRALSANTTAGGNTATGWEALFLNTTGSLNTALGVGALYINTTGSNNTAVGSYAGGSVANVGYTTGSNNIAIGSSAALDVSGGNSNNIHIGSAGFPADSGVIRIGTLGTQTSFFAAGIRGVTTGASDAVPVMIDSTGQLGTVSSSIRFKEDVQDMDAASSGLMRLRPVTYRYTQPFSDGSKPLEYGLIAEEVRDVYPDLVVKGADGQVETVQYQKLTPMLLNELQKQEKEIIQQKNLNRKLEERIAALEAILARDSQSLRSNDQ